MKGVLFFKKVCYVERMAEMPSNQIIQKSSSLNFCFQQSRQCEGSFMTKDQLQLLSVAVLRDMAKKSGVKSVSALRKSALVDALLENQKNHSENSSGHGSESSGLSPKDHERREEHGRQNPDRDESRVHASGASRKSAKANGAGSARGEELQDVTGNRTQQTTGVSHETVKPVGDTAAGQPAPDARAVRAAVPAVRVARCRGPEGSCGEGRPGSWQEAGSK